MKILGLDIGTNSIGWALVQENKSIIDCGVRIFPVGVKEDDYNKSGSEVSKNAGRRMARTIRRSYYRYKLRRKALVAILTELGMMPGNELITMPSKQLYGLRKRALDEKVSLQELGRIFLLLNQRRGFKSGKKERGTTDEKEKSKIKQEMIELEQKVRAANCRTLGEYFYLLFLQNEDDPNCYNPEEPVERIRARFVDRKLYNEEFDAIWDKQKTYYPNILTEANKKRIKDDCIFYQRKLKSQKHLVGFCRFEPQKRCCPISSDTFQQFRIWQVINNMRISGNGLYREPLTTDDKQLLFEAVNTKEDYTEATVKTILKLNRSVKLNDLPPKLKGNTTNARIAKAIGADVYYSLTDKEKKQLWHILFFAEDEDWIYNYCIKKFGFDHEQATKLAGVQLEEGYASVSSKALLKGKDKDVVDNGILFHLKNGKEYSEAARLAGYHHSYDSDANDPDRVLVDKVVIIEKDRLKNPLVQQCISECARLVNAVIKEHGRPDMIRIEMARSLKKPKSEREQAKRKNDDKERTRDSYREFLKKELSKEYISKAELIKFELFLEMGYSETELKKLNSNIDVEEFKKFSRRVSSNDKEKYELWLECGRISPYTGKIISLSKLFSPEIDIEHIVPYSRCMNDSFMNKTLCEREINDAKDNKTPYEYLGSNPAAWKEFKARISGFTEAKQKQFTMQELPDDFLNSQLTNTAYIAREVVSHFKKVCKKVTVTNGQATSLLRKFWGLNELLNPNRENEKSRLDHRHHTIDAIVVACTSDAYIQKLSKESQFDGYGRIRVENIKFPYPSFKLEVNDKLHKILVSYRNKKRLLNSKTNKYIHSTAINGVKQKTLQVRGPLHEETLYGQITNPYTGENNYVTRKPISSIETEKQIDKVVDKKIQEIIMDHIAANGGNIKQAMALPLFMKTNDGKQVPIHTVRMTDNAEQLIRLRPKENPKLFVASGNNYCIAIYEGENGKRDFETVSFYNAVKKKKEGKRIVPLTKDDKKLLCALKQKDMVVLYKEHPDEIDWENIGDIHERLCQVIKFDVAGQIFFGRHLISKLDKKTDRNINLFQQKYSTMKAVKVNIDVLGKIKPI